MLGALHFSLSRRCTKMSWSTKKCFREYSESAECVVGNCGTGYIRQRHIQWPGGCQQIFCYAALTTSRSAPQKSWYEVQLAKKRWPVKVVHTSQIDSVPISPCCICNYFLCPSRHPPIQLDWPAPTESANSQCSSLCWTWYCAAGLVCN